MKNIKLLLIILFTSLLLPTVAISQTTLRTTLDSTITITQRQLKITNLIFAEHNKWSSEIPILNSEILSYKSLVKNYEQGDSLNRVELNLYKEKISESEKNVKSLKKKLKLTKTTGISGGVLLFLIGFLIGK